MKKNIKYLMPLIYLILEVGLYSSAMAQNSIDIDHYSTLHPKGNNWFFVREFSEILENSTPEKAFKKALEKAYRMVLEYQGIEINAISVSSRDDITNKDIFISLSTQLTKGIILEKKILKRENQVINNKFYVVIEADLRIGKLKGAPDPYFNLDAAINKHTFITGENIKINISVSQNSYIYIFNICSDENVYQLFPNKFNSDNFLHCGEKFTLPTHEDKKRTISYPVILLPGRKKDTEIIKILACKKKLTFPGFSEDKAYNSYKNSIESFLNTLIKIKRNDITEYDIPYSIFLK